MRIESAVTSITWIPSEAIRGMMKMPFEMGVAHYDEAPPDVVEDLEALREADRFRFANTMRAWIDVEAGRISGWGQEGHGMIGSTSIRLGSRGVTIPAVALPDIAPEPDVRDTSVRFLQTAGGRTGVPAPRRVRRKPFVQISAPLAWTTLSLTLHVDGRAEPALAGASPFPRHWVYDAEGKLVAKSGLIDFKTWYRRAFGRHTPWGDRDSPALVTQVESALERELSGRIMRGGTAPEIRALRKGATLVEQGQEGSELFLLLDGVLRVEVGGEPLTEVGPGAVLGERAILEGGRRTSTLRAVTPCRVAVARADQIDRSALEEVARGHRREDR